MLFKTYCHVFVTSGLILSCAVTLVTQIEGGGCPYSQFFNSVLNREIKETNAY